MLTPRTLLGASRLVLALVATWTFVSPLPQAAPGDSKPTEPPLFSRITVIGASASDGYGLRTEVGASVTLTDCVRSALRSPGELSHGADAMFFGNPYKIGSRQIEKTVEAQPSLVVAVDYLFWFAYGFAPSDDARYNLFESGLAMLDRLECPILVGTLPDMSPALKGRGPFGGPLIQPQQVPSPEARAKMNERLLAWAEKTDGQVIVVPLARFVAQLNAKDKLELRGNTWDPAAGARMMQADLLHPTLDGTIALGLLVLDTLVENRDDVAADTVVWESSKVREAIYAATEDERRKAEERKRRREERKRAREEQKKQEEGAGV